MRNTLRLALALVFAAMAATNSGGARADERSAMSTQESSFQLFGTRICVADAGGERCDLQLPANLLSQVPESRETNRARVWRFLGLTFCTEVEPTGPACDVVWVPPVSTAVAWRDARMGVSPGGAP